MKRGMLNDEVQPSARFYLDREINQVELRLIPFIHYCSINGGLLDYRKINAEELAYLGIWEQEDLVTLHGDMVYVSRKFWDMANQILWDSYAVKLGDPS